MSIEDLLTSVSLRSNSFYDSYASGSGDASSIKFAEMVKACIGCIKSDFDQELVLYAYIEQGDKDYIIKHIINMVIFELPESTEVMSKIAKLKRTNNLTVYLKGTYTLYGMVKSCAYVALAQAVTRKQISSRVASGVVGCSKDTYISNYQAIVDTVSRNLTDRLSNAERKIKAVMYE